MFRRMLSSAISMALLASGSAAHAGISEVYANFPNQTTALLHPDSDSPGLCRQLFGLHLPGAAESLDYDCDLELD